MKLATLVRREWWECRRSFLLIPMSVGTILVILAAIALFIFSISNIDIEAVNWRTYVSDAAISNDIVRLSRIFNVTLWLIVFHYFLGSLYHDRKNGSVLFWQSMPISQTEMIISKLLAGLVLAPLLSWVCMIITESLILTLFGFGLSLFNLPAMQMLWHPHFIILRWVHLLTVMLLQGLYLFPVLGWMMFCSAYAKHSPFLLAIVPPVLAILIEELSVGTHDLWHFISIPASELSQLWVSKSNLSSYFYSVDLLYGFLVGLFFIILGGLLRSRCYGFDR